MEEATCPKCGFHLSEPKSECPRCGIIFSEYKLKPSLSENKPATKKCPFCAEEILTDAIKCKHCQSSLVVDEIQIAQPQPKKKGGLGKYIGIGVLLFIGIGFIGKTILPVNNADKTNSLPATQKTNDSGEKE